MGKGIKKLVALKANGCQHNEDEWLVQEQLKLEQLAVDEVVHQYELRKASGKPLPPHFALINMGMKPLTEAIRRFLVSGHGREISSAVRQYIADMEPEHLAFLTLHTVITEHVNKGYSPLPRLAIQVYNAIRDYKEYHKFKEEKPKLLRTILSNLRTNHMRHRRAVIFRAKRLFDVPDDPRPKAAAEIGAKLIDLLIANTGMFTIREHYALTGRTSDIVVLSDAARKWLDKAHQYACDILRPKYMPMVIEPKPWTSLDDGGYYTLRLEAIKDLRNIEDYLDQEAKGFFNVDLSKAFEALNALQATRWRVNKDVLAVVEEVWKLPDKLGLLPSTDVELPDKPWEVIGMDYEEFKEQHPDQVRTWKKTVTAIMGDMIAEKSKYIAAGRTLSIAKQMVQYEAIYFPWTMDFRGRMYPVPAFLNPQGDDLAKGLLEFADGVELGESGVKWLAIHLANCWANTDPKRGKPIDKLPFEDRIAWVHENEDMILDAGNNPLDGTKAWTEADEPWQFLAACFEWAKYKQNGPLYKSHLPVSVDGSCNGLQHFAALQRDKKGGETVNLIPSPEPSDVYAKVAKAATEIARSSEDPIAQAWLEACGGEITRAWTKRNTMTIPYGVTKEGMKIQIAKELREAGPEFAELKDKLFLSAAVLAEINTKAIQATLSSAMEVKEWLQNVAKIFNEHKLPICWTTPTGFRVVQRKRKHKLIRIETFFGVTRLKNKEKAKKVTGKRMTVAESTEQLDKTRQRHGISPNVIHSLDASHLVFTVRECLAQGIKDFAMVHDSYGCHAGHLDTMAGVLREQFVKLYSENRLQDLYEQFKAQLPEDVELPEPPPLGNLDINDVKNSLYFFA
jgi:DNA-directed RNA polymerase